MGELLAAVAPEDLPHEEIHLPGDWLWFGDPENWLGAPKGHEPIDKVAEARELEQRRTSLVQQPEAAIESSKQLGSRPRQAADSLAPSPGLAKSRARHGLQYFTASSTCRQSRWPSGHSTMRLVE